MPGRRGATPSVTALHTGIQFLGQLCYPGPFRRSRCYSRLPLCQGGAYASNDVWLVDEDIAMAGDPCDQVPCARCVTRPSRDPLTEIDRRSKEGPGPPSATRLFLPGNFTIRILIDACAAMPIIWKERSRHGPISSASICAMHCVSKVFRKLLSQALSARSQWWSVSVASSMFAIRAFCVRRAVAAAPSRAGRSRRRGLRISFYKGEYRVSPQSATCV